MAMDLGLGEIEEVQTEPAAKRMSIGRVPNEHLQELKEAVKYIAKLSLSSALQSDCDNMHSDANIIRLLEDNEGGDSGLRGQAKAIQRQKDGSSGNQGGGVESNDNVDDDANQDAFRTTDENVTGNGTERRLRTKGAGILGQPVSASESLSFAERYDHGCSSKLRRVPLVLFIAHESLEGFM